MSIYRMTAVFKHSRQKANKRLMMLAIADNADDIGLAWPGYDHLAEKTYMSRLTAIRCVEYLECRTRELLVYRRPGKSNAYLVLTGFDRKQQKASVAHMCKELDITVHDLAVQRLQAWREYQSDTPDQGAQTGDRGVNPGKPLGYQVETSPVNPGKPEPSITIIEPPDSAPDGAGSSSTTGKPRKRDPVFDAIAVTLFNADLEDTAAVEAIGGRVGKVRAKLKRMAVTTHEFRDACDWYRQTSPDISLPRDAEKAASMIIDYRAWVAERKRPRTPEQEEAIRLAVEAANKAEERFDG